MLPSLAPGESQSFSEPYSSLRPLMISGAAAPVLTRLSSMPRALVRETTTASARCAQFKKLHRQQSQRTAGASGLILARRIVRPLGARYRRTGENRQLHSRQRGASRLMRFASRFSSAFGRYEQDGSECALVAQRHRGFDNHRWIRSTRLLASLRKPSSVSRRFRVTSARSTRVTATAEHTSSQPISQD
jgi:hypothetical protein